MSEREAYERGRIDALRDAANATAKVLSPE